MVSKSPKLHTFGLRLGHATIVELRRDKLFNVCQLDSLGHMGFVIVAKIVIMH